VSLLAEAGQRIDRRRAMGWEHARRLLVWNVNMSGAWTFEGVRQDLSTQKHLGVRPSLTEP
jgi:hypothetical protein